MIVRQGTWSELSTGCYIRDLNGIVWRIDKEREGNFLVVNRAGDRKRLHPQPGSKTVTILEPSDDEAVTALRETLGAEIVAERERTGVPDKPWVIRPWELETFSMQKVHMKLLHGVYVEDVKSPEELTEAHDSFTEKPSHAHVPHIHRKG